MSYNFLKLIFFLFLFSCVSKSTIKTNEINKSKSFFINKGFALVYEDKHYKKKIVSNKIEDRSLIIFQKNLKKNTPVKITNLLNSKNLIAKVGDVTEYPFFYNSVVSKRIKDELELDKNQPYVEIKEIIHGSSFIAKKAKTYDQEKKVADKAPVDEIKIKDLSNNDNPQKKTKKKDFNYIIKIADFYFIKSANLMKSRIIDETSIKKVKIMKLSPTKFRVFVGPFSDLNSLKKSFNAINVLKFDSLEIIKNAE